MTKTAKRSSMRSAPSEPAPFDERLNLQVGGREDPSLARMGAFSDGVFAFAVTLLIVAIRIPHPTDADASQGLLILLTQQWTSYLAFVLSFILLGTARRGCCGPATGRGRLFGRHCPLYAARAAVGGAREAQTHEVLGRAGGATAPVLQ